MSSKTHLTGCFYFKKTATGNLIGEFTNETLHKVQTESSDYKNKIGHEALDEVNNGFSGKYDSTWFEDNTSHDLVLTITLKPNSNSKIFCLEWYNIKTKKAAFEGEGFIVDEMLIGYYKGK